MAANSANSKARKRARIEGSVRALSSARSPTPEAIDITAKLNPRQVAALSFLMQGCNPVKTAEEVGVTAQTIRAWMVNPEFQWAFNYFRAELMQHTIDTLRLAQSDAITYMRDMVNDGSQMPHNRIRAAGKILDIMARHHPVIPEAEDGPVNGVESELYALARHNPDVTELILALKEAVEVARAKAAE